MLIEKLDIPTRWRNRLKRHYWNESYFNELLKRLETNSDIDPVFVEIDKSRFLKMRKDNQNKIVAGRSYQEILDRFDMKIKDPRKTPTGKSNSKIIKESLRILKYHTLGFNLITGSKDEVERKKEFKKIQ